MSRHVVAFASLFVVVAACKASPDAAGAKPVAVPKSNTAAPSTELNSPCEAEKDCAAIPGATCMKGGLGPTKGGLCRILCKGPTDDRCSTPNACLSSGVLDGVEHFSCERTCVGDTDCHADGYSCQHVLGPTQRAFCVASMAAKK